MAMEKVKEEEVMMLMELGDKINSLFFKIKLF